MSLPSSVMSMHEDIYEECYSFCEKRMCVMGYFPWEIAAEAKKMYEEKIEKMSEIS